MPDARGRSGNPKQGGGLRMSVPGKDKKRETDSGRAVPRRGLAVKNILISVLSLLAAAVIGCAAFVIAGESVGNIYDADFTASLVDKYDRINTGEVGRIIFIGGSSLPFGIRSDVIEQKLGKEVTDFGVYAALGTRMMCEIALECANSGDVLVLAPELTSQTYSLYFSAPNTWQALCGRREIIRCLSADEKWKMAAAYFPFLASKLRSGNSYTGMGNSIYSRSSFNEWGDICVERPRNVMPRKYVPDQPVRFEGLESEEFFDYLNKWASDAEKKGCSVLFTFCPVNRPAAEYTGAESDAFADRIASELTFPVMGSPEEMTYDSKWFYNTNFHLNSSGALLHTSVILDFLCEALGTEWDGDLAIPEPGSIIQPDDIIADNSDADLFEYEDIGGSWSVKLKDEYRKTVESVTVPASFEGKIVSGIGPGCFAGCTALRSVTVPDSVRLFEIGAFEDCRALSEIKLLITRPDETAAPQTGLFSGASDALKVYVPDQAYSMYLNDYSWRSYKSLFARLSEANEGND